MDFHTAVKTEIIWQEMMLKFAGISGNIRHITAENSGHYIHLTDLDVVVDAVNSFNK